MGCATSSESGSAKKRRRKSSASKKDKRRKDKKPKRGGGDAKNDGDDQPVFTTIAVPALHLGAPTSILKPSSGDLKAASGNSANDAGNMSGLSEDFMSEAKLKMAADAAGAESGEFSRSANNPLSPSGGAPLGGDAARPPRQRKVTLTPAEDDRAPPAARSATGGAGPVSDRPGLLSVTTGMAHRSASPVSPNVPLERSSTGKLAQSEQSLAESELHGGPPGGAATATKMGSPDGPARDSPEAFPRAANPLAKPLPATNGGTHSTDVDELRSDGGSGGSEGGERMRARRDDTTTSPDKKGGPAVAITTKPSGGPPLPPPGAVIVTIQGRQYNFQPLLNRHPGGADILRQFDQRDATSAFLSNHSRPPWAALRKYEFPQREL